MFTFSAVREMVSPLILAIITIVTLLFDMSVPAGAYGLLTDALPVVFVEGETAFGGIRFVGKMFVFERHTVRMSGRQGNETSASVASQFDYSSGNTVSMHAFAPCRADGSGIALAFLPRCDFREQGIGKVSHATSASRSAGGFAGAPKHGSESTESDNGTAATERLSEGNTKAF